MKYYANFDANNGTHYGTPITGTNKKELIKDIRSIAEAERFAGNECCWCVYIKDSDGDSVSVARGGMVSNGCRWRDNTREIL